MKKSFILFLVFVLFSFQLPVQSCTTAIISGKATIDGRPLILKHRDADALQNRLVFFTDGKYKYIGLVNSHDTANAEVWAGFNETGFGIMNSASYNLRLKDTSKLKDLEGVIMKKALQVCASLEDFEKLLTELPKPLGVEANFGVVDALGGVAYYEVDNYKFIKFDANDPVTAPNGYIIRTNYSFAGEENQGAGYIRYQTASKVFTDKYEEGKFSFDFLLNDIPRCLTHSFTNENLLEKMPDNSEDTRYVYFRDYIPRYFSSAAVVIQGVVPGESPKLATMWTILGFPLSSVAVPVWITDEGKLPLILQRNEKGIAPLCDLALKLKDNMFSTQKDARENYINLAAVANKDKTGILQKLAPIEEEVLNKAKNQISAWRENGFDNTGAVDFYNWIDGNLLKEIKTRFKMK